MTRWQAATEDERTREREQTRRSSAKLRTRMRTIIAAAKGAPCADCGKHFPACAMDLDHVRGRKKFNVSTVQLAYGTSLRSLHEEIEKCDVVCANCHRIRSEARGYLGVDR